MAKARGSRIAHGDEPLAGKDEGDRRRSRLALLGLIEQGRRHEIGAVLLIEAARRLDLLLLLAGRHVELERPLDLFLLLRRGIEEIDPNGGFGDPRLALLALERAGAVLIDGEHRTSRFRARTAEAGTLSHRTDLIPARHVATETLRPTDVKNRKAKVRNPDPRAQFFCTMQAPPSERRAAHSLAASARLSAPICTIYSERRPRLKFRSGSTKGSRPPSSASCAASACRTGRAPWTWRTRSRHGRPTGATPRSP